MKAVFESLLIGGPLAYTLRPTEVDRTGRPVKELIFSRRSVPVGAEGAICGDLQPPSFRGRYVLVCDEDRPTYVWRGPSILPEPEPLEPVRGTGPGGVGESSILVGASRSGHVGINTYAGIGLTGWSGSPDDADRIAVRILRSARIAREGKP